MTKPAAPWPSVCGPASAVVLPPGVQLLPEDERPRVRLDPVLCEASALGDVVPTGTAWTAPYSLDVPGVLDATAVLVQWDSTPGPLVELAEDLCLLAADEDPGAGA